MMGRESVAFAIAMLLAIGGCSQETASSESLGRVTQALEGGTTTVEFSVELAAGTSTMLLSASNQLTINGGGTVGIAGTVSNVAGFGEPPAQTQIQSGQNVWANLLSEGSVTVSPNATVHGFVQSGGAVEAGPPSYGAVEGGIVLSSPSSETVRWSVEWPNGCANDVMNYAANSLPAPGDPGIVVAPGCYDRFDVMARNRLTFSSGKYFFESFFLDKDAELRIDSSDGPVAIYVRNSFNYVGRLLPKQDGSGNPVVPEGLVLVAYAGQNQATLNGPFVGTFVGMNANVALQNPNMNQHKGSFFGKNLTVDASSKPVLPLTVSLIDVVDELEEQPVAERPDCESDRNPDGSVIPACLTFSLASTGRIVIADSARVEGTIGTSFQPAQSPSLIEPIFQEGVITSVQFPGFNPDSFAVVVGVNAVAAPGSSIVASSVFLKQGAHVDTLLADRVVAQLGANFERRAPFTPLPTTSPVSSFVPGGQHIQVGLSEVLTLAPGSYDSLQVAGTLLLQGGTYELFDIVLGGGAELIALDRTTLLVDRSLVGDVGATIYPANYNPFDLTLVVPAGDELSRVDLLGGSSMIGSIFARDVPISLGDDVSFYGPIVGGRIEIGEGSRLRPPGPDLTRGLLFQCDSSADCNDGNACTLDLCDGNCRSIRQPTQGGVIGCGHGVCDGTDCVCESGYLGRQCELEDLDHDSVRDDQDNCVGVNNPDQQDVDNDGVGDACDNCPVTANVNQANMDGDSAGDACDGVTTITVNAHTNEPVVRNVLDGKTVALSYIEEDLPIDTNANPGAAILKARDFVGQELTVFNYPFGLGPGNIGVEHFQGPFSDTFGFPFITGLRFSTVTVDAGDQRRIDYPHDTSHVVRYIHGSCAVRAPWAPIFQRVVDVMEHIMLCESPGYIDLERIFFEMQPFFKGEVGDAEVNQAPVHMGLSFSAQYRGTLHWLPNAGSTVGLNPGYEVGVGSNGLIDIKPVAANVQVIFQNSTAGTDELKDRVQEELLDNFPVEIESSFNDALTVRVAELADELVGNTPVPSEVRALNCDSSASNAAQSCFNQVQSRLQLVCANTLCPIFSTSDVCRLCRSRSNLTPADFVCRSNDACDIRLNVSSSCVPGTSAGRDTCFDNSSRVAQLGCDLLEQDSACLAGQVFEPRNFECLPDSTCGFHPIVQQLNVLPTEIEVVFAPDPERPEVPLDRFYRDIAGGSLDICGPALADRTIINAPVTALQLAGAAVTSSPSISCDQDPDFSDILPF